MSLLSIVQTACDRLSLTRPSAVVSSTDKLVRQLLGITIEAAEAMSRRGQWEALTNEHTFVTVAAAEQTNTPLPDDLRDFIPDSFFNRTTGRPVYGPVTPQRWQLAQANEAAAALYVSYRKRAGTLLLTPTPTAGQTIAYEYISKYWARSSAGAAKATFTADEDETYLDEELLTLDIKWRFKQAKGLDYGEDMATAERAIELALGHDGGSGALSIAGACDDLLTLNIPQTIPV